MASQGSCAYVVDIQSVRHCGACHLSVKETPSLFGPNPALATHPLPPEPRQQQTTGCMFDEPLSKLPLLSIPGSLFTWGYLEYREVGESGFPLFHAWPIDALQP